MSVAEREIAILDFGSQYTHLIARRIRELGVKSSIYPTNTPTKRLQHAWGIILSGGPKSVVSERLLPYDKKLFSLDVPILGLCYGHQLMAHVHGGKVERGTEREYGPARLSVSVKPSPLLAGVANDSIVWMSHGDHVSVLPPGFALIGASSQASIAAMANETRKLYGLQFHPEVYHSRYGKRILRNFLFTICGAEKNWLPSYTEHAIIERLRAEVGEKNVFLLVSGGVDSTVCFALLQKIFGTGRVYGLHIDHGLMRLNESKKILRALNAAGFKNLHVHHAERQFLQALKGVTEPEKKRHIIGNLFLDTTDHVMRHRGLGDDSWVLAQGTIYPDTIESGGTKNAVVIKTHHNRVPKIQSMIAEGRIVEPLRDLYKDEVRILGQGLGLPIDLVKRHPFPGPGLAIRILCHKGRREKAVLLSENNQSDYKLFRLPVQSVGVQGDERSYAHPGLILPARKITDKKFWPEIKRLSPIITNRHHDINRVAIMIVGSTKRLEQATLQNAEINRKRIKILQTIDDIIHRFVLKSSACRHIWQLPVVLIPFGDRHKESIVLRPFTSEEAMTASFAIIPTPILKKIIAAINRLDVIDFILYDATNKPPGTIEWE